ncbi:MAG TPA: hypothetical protein DD827_03455 [Gammaproteobacteria bacterium]|nr:hypothetical protein [Gammaproteobacteria bacterium]
MIIRFLKAPSVLVLLLFTVALASCIQSSNLKLKTPFTDESNIISIKLGNKTPLSELIQELTKADYVLLGEAHNDPAHHQRQQQILDLLIKAGRKPAVVFEMFNREDEGLITSTTRRFPLDPDKVAAAVNWEESGWPDWQMYRPIVKSALDGGLQLVAGNLSRTKARQLITDYDSFMPDIKTLTQLGMREPLPQVQQKLLQTRISSAHGKGIPDLIVNGMVLAQRMRDATMAEAMIARNFGQGAVLIAGQEHVRADYGVPRYLRFREPEARIVSLAFAESEDLDGPINSADNSQHPFDFVWLLPQNKDQLVAHPLTSP